MMSPHPNRPRPVVVDFHRTKYGRELLVDAAMVSSMPTFLRDEQPHTLTFHDILIVTRGAGQFWLDGEPHPVSRGAVLFTLPGQIRQWRVTGLDGACLFFTAEFIEDFFRDERFLRDLAYFRPGRPAADLPLPAARLRARLRRFRAMADEIRQLRPGTEHVLRAILYELLIALERDYIEHWGAPVAATMHPLVDRFLARVERRFRREHRLEPYARDLAVTPGHLGQLCRLHLGYPAGGVIRRRIAVEARRQLRHSSLPVSVIGESLGFADPAYFARFVRRETGRPPSAFRDAGR